MSITPGTRPGNRPGPKPRLTREAIVEAAVEVGVDRLSIGAVAERLGVAPGTLYRYVDGLDEIATSAIALVFARTPLPPAGRGWRAFLEEEAGVAFDLMVRYSGLLQDLGTDLSAVAGDRMERIIGILGAAGFGLTAAARVADAVLDMAADGATQTRWVRGDGGGPGDLSAPARAFLTTVADPLRAEILAMMTHPREHVLDKIGLVLDGVELRRSRGDDGYAGIAPPP